MIKKTLLFIFPVLLFISCGKEETAPPGHIIKDTTWSGNVTLTSDVIVDTGVTLTIEPGTVITVMADQDDTGLSHLGSVDDLTTSDPTADPDAGGVEYQQSHISIIINGTIISRGTANAPIKFKSSKQRPHYTDWTGITVNNGVFEYTLVEWCLDGIYSLDGCEQFSLDHCVIRHCWAAGVGFSSPANSNIQTSIKHCTIEDCGHEAIDTHSPGNIEMAYNLLKDSQVGFNLHDDITANIHNNIVVNTTFPFICVNSSDVFITQCTLQAQIQDNSRWTYDGWTMPLFENPAAIFVANSTTSSVIATNSIIFDSTTGLRDHAPAESLASGYFDMFNVSVPHDGNALQGAGFLQVDPKFVDKTGGDYRLAVDSPLKTAGNTVDGNPELGAFGGSDAEEVIGYNIE